jgi:predicted Ser/Thr protein kinase
MMNGAKKIATSFNTISSLKRFFFSPTRLMQATKIFFAVHCLRNIFLIIYIWCLSTTGSLLSPCVTAQQTTNITQTTATLSEARAWLAASSASELVFFGGGYSGQVDICNVTSGSWSTATLSVPRGLLAATSSGNLVFFAGGQNGSPPTYYNQVDIYDLSYGKWTTATLSQARAALAATSVGNLVLFGGGATIYSGWLSVVDIYNVSSNTWTTAALSQSRYYLTATSVANRYALFAGGWSGTIPQGASDIVDIYDFYRGLWSTASLSQARGFLASASFGELAFFGGGAVNGGQTSNVVDIFNATTYTWHTAALSQAREWLAAAAIADIVAFGGGAGSTFLPVVDMYDLTRSMWFTANLSQARIWLAGTSASNKIFFGGGQNSSGGLSNVVDIFDILSPPTMVTPSFQTSPQSFTTITPSNFPNKPISLSSAPNTIISTSMQQYTLPALKLNASSNARDNNSTATLLAGVLIAVAVLVIAAIILLILLIRKMRKNEKLRNARNIEDMMNRRGQKRVPVMLEGFMNTFTMTETIATQTTFQAETEINKVELCEIPLNELEIGKEVGEGKFGRVCLGKWKKYRVALKFCQNKGSMDEFMKEATLMISLPPHPNVVRMYGVSIDGTQPIIVMEYCGGGSLDKVLFDREEQISNEQKIRWVYEIALGMRHLHKHNIVHRDLAARNILLSHPNLNEAQLKISDFGMARVLKQDIEGKTMNSIGPIRWMAPESIRDQVYSKKSDVWMFGILVYEIVAQCEPHCDIDPKDVGVLIRDKGLTPTIPSNSPQKLRQVMEMCWKKQPVLRPNFELVCAMLEH